MIIAALLVSAGTKGGLTGGTRRAAPLRLWRQKIATGCTVQVKHTNETLEAHVALDDNLQAHLGDRIFVHGAPVQISFGETLYLRRSATLTRASLFDKLWVRLKSLFLITELYEVSFSPTQLHRPTTQTGFLK
ncbi:MAG: hypothetical protein AAFY04_03655 [Pseudomonadota bacterium]